MRNLTRNLRIRINSARYAAAPTRRWARLAGKNNPINCGREHAHAFRHEKGRLAAGNIHRHIMAFHVSKAGGGSNARQ